MKSRDKNLTSAMVKGFIGLLLACSFCAAENQTPTRVIPPSPAPQTQEMLLPMLEFTWSAGPPMPLGNQDNRCGVIEHWLIAACGFCSGADYSWKPDKYLRGFYKDVYALDLSNQKNGWTRLPNFPGIARQGMQAVSVNNAFYVWGGFSYTNPYTFKDGYKLSLKNGKWLWEKLPPLPWSLTWGATCAVGLKIYIIGGSDFDYKRFYTDADRNHQVKNLGARLIVFDTHNPNAGWKELTSCPGTHRCFTAAAVVEDKMYVIGGVSGPTSSSEMYSVVDSWLYDPDIDNWERLRDLPVSTADIGPGLLAFKDRYILLPCGYPRKVISLDGSTRPIYGNFSKVNRTWENHPSLKGVSYFNHFYVYDTKTNLYGTATKLPYDDSTPGTYVFGDSIYMFPCETGGFVWQGEYFGHHPEFVLIGKIKEMY